MDIRAIIFDKDGTIVDFPATFNPATRSVLEQLSGGDQTLLQGMADVWEFDLSTNQIREGSMLISDSGYVLARELTKVLPVDDLDAFATRLDKMFGKICVETAVALPGAPEALRTLQANNVSLGIGTNDSEENAVSQLQALGLTELFHKILGADSGYGAKPGPGMVSAFIEECGLEPSQVMMVGDSLHDLDAGRAAGAVTCGVETGPTDRETLEKSADMVLSSIADLPEIVSRSM